MLYAIALEMTAELRAMGLSPELYGRSLADRYLRDDYDEQMIIHMDLGVPKHRGQYLKVRTLVAQVCLYATYATYRLADLKLRTYYYCDPAFPDNLYSDLLPAGRIGPATSGGAVSDVA